MSYEDLDGCDNLSFVAMHYLLTIHVVNNLIEDGSLVKIIYLFL